MTTAVISIGAIGGSVATTHERLSYPFTNRWPRHPGGVELVAYDRQYAPRQRGSRRSVEDLDERLRLPLDLVIALGSDA